MKKVWFTPLLLLSLGLFGQTPSVGSPFVEGLDSPAGFLYQEPGNFLVWNAEGQSFFYPQAEKTPYALDFIEGVKILDILHDSEGEFFLVAQNTAELLLYKASLGVLDESIDLADGTDTSAKKKMFWSGSQVLWETPLEISVKVRLLKGTESQLFLGISDGGLPEKAQEDDSFLGKILSFDLTESETQGVKGKVPTLYAKGFRQPTALTFWKGQRFYGLDLGPDPTRGRGMDEVNVIEKDKNYGWPLIFGNQSRKSLETPFIQSTLARSWDPTQALIPDSGKWAGHLVYAGGSSGTLYRLVLDEKNPKKILFQDEQFFGKYGPLRGILQNQEGEIFLLTEGKTAGSGAILPLKP